jgi:hypothetical protein
LGSEVIVVLLLKEKIKEKDMQEKLNFMYVGFDWE